MMRARSRSARWRPRRPDRPGHDRGGGGRRRGCWGRSTGGPRDRGRPDLGGSPLIKLLLSLRSLPGFILHGCHPSPRNQKIRLRILIESGFGVLAEEPDKEIVLGVSGKFWRPAGNLSPFNREDFDQPVPPGIERAVWNFSIKEGDNGRTILSTETRVICGDDASRRKFRTYWFFVRPFSGLIRLIMLKRVKRAVDTGH